MERDQSEEPKIGFWQPRQAPQSFLKESTPVQHNQSDGLRIGIWGPREAGKTTYVVTVWGACLDPDSTWDARPDDLDTSEFVIDHLTKLRETGDFPAPTAETLEPTHYTYHFSPRVQEPEENASSEGDNPLERLRRWIRSDEVATPSLIRGQEVVVSFTDVAGEQYLKSPLNSPLWEDMWNCNGLLCLLDPANPGSHFRSMLTLVQRLALKGKPHPSRLIGGKLPHYIALCFSKIDQPGFYEYKDKPQELVKKLSSKSRIDLSRILTSTFLPERIKVFSVSCIGVDDSGESLAKSGRIITPNEIRPTNIIKPLRWLFEALNEKHP